MILAKATNRACEMQILIARVQVRVALCANGVRCGSQQESSLVFYVARTASRRERLSGMVRWRVVAGKAKRVGDRLKISARQAQMAELTLPCKHCMRS
jgi:hypothetical protein